ncbi:MAG: cupin domain-containing protein [Clostridia bacterium]|nr:cupin domain-containing protein [Clostridia bacterium]
MIKNKLQLKKTLKENMRGGNGIVELTELVDPAELNGHGRLFSTITLRPGCSIGWHVHEGESEIFAVVSGTGVYNDNGKEVAISEGFVTVVRSGEGHAVSCLGPRDLVLTALIINA